MEGEDCVFRENVSILFIGLAHILRRWIMLTGGCWVTRRLQEDEPLQEQGWVEGNVVNAMVFAKR